MKYKERDLFLWGDELYKLQEWANEHGDGFLQKWVDYQQKVGGGKPEHTILCPEMPSYLRRVSREANKLPKGQQVAVKAYYSAQLVDGQRPKEETIAIKIGMKISDFKNYWRKGRINLLKNLNS